MRILLANDDGIDAPGLALLAEAARLVSDDVWIVAPEEKRTAASSSLTIARPLKMTRRAEKTYACSGTPADCVIAAMAWLFKDGKRPDIVLGGVNDGRNTAEDIAYSGTLAIAREATFWGVPAVGFSRVKRPEVTETDPTWLSHLIARLVAERDAWSIEGHWLSVNLPSRLAGAVAVQPARFGRDKIGGFAEVVEEHGNETTIIFPRGRPHTVLEGDDNGLIDAGKLTINRLNWFGQTPLEEAFVETLL
ncbi:5'/3'-nucleotidase SurE [Limoniibacter endophyticus]|uniref:5'-nucleotidase SurE n=1 Tax=Limoniibacter endophyticus TaxID=1565040 RepID=A0A8J3DNA3_9HYPH|nr:5'/3'-nucleotidase SurE [Limoniibacter endophyticus]GHC70217.1 5'-nucleotidase SurE [Limoniibacter endophyticus]